MSQDNDPSNLTSQFTHDLLNRVGAAKMNAELALRNSELPEKIKKNLDRILSNLTEIERMVSGRTSTIPDSLPDPQPPTTMRSRSHVSVLLIDDSPDFRSLFIAILKPRGYNLHVAKDREEAAAILRTGEKFNLVLLDYNLGDVTGSQILDSLEALQLMPDEKTKIVLFSADGAKVSDVRTVGTEQKSMSVSDMIALVEKYTQP